MTNAVIALPAAYFIHGLTEVGILDAVFLALGVSVATWWFVKAAADAFRRGSRAERRREAGVALEAVLTKKGYHPYVFDERTRAFVGRFEDMYRAEHKEGFDSWHQEDQRVLSRVVTQAVLHRFNFNRILDVGCGKGAFTHLLKKANNHIVALDVSSTAIDIARGRYPDIEFIQADVSARGFDLRGVGAPFDVVVSIQALSYVERWRELLAQFAQVGLHVMIVLDLPENPIGFVKTFEDLTEEFTKHCRVLDDIRFVTQRQVLLFGQSLRVAPPPPFAEE